MLHHQHEAPAAIITLTPAMRAAILAAAGGSLKRLLRGWAANGHPAPINHRTVLSVQARGLLIVGQSTARLSHTGKWYARTLARAVAMIPQPNDEALG